MRNLLTDYREETTKELVQLYIKSCILKEYFFIFPFLRKLKFDGDDFYNYLINKLKRPIGSSYFEKIAPYISETDFSTISKKEIAEIQDILSNNGMNFVEDFPIMAFSAYKPEKGISNAYSFSQEKYSENNMFIEYYLNIGNAPITEALNELEISIIQRSFSLQGVVDPTHFKEWMIGLQGFISQDRFFALIKSWEIGVRLVYNSNFVTRNRNEAQLYSSICGSHILDKTNALSFKLDDSDITHYKFPLILAKAETHRLPNSFVGLRNYIDSAEFFSDIDNLKSELWKDDNFAKLFNYHFPIKILQTIIFSHIVKKYKLMAKVAEKNKIFEDLDDAIIKILFRIKNAEDPTNI